MARSLYLFQTAVLGCAACNKNEAMHLKCLASPFDAAPRAPDCINVRSYETDEGEPKEKHQHQSTALRNGQPRFSKGEGSTE